MAQEAQRSWLREQEGAMSCASFGSSKDGAAPKGAKILVCSTDPPVAPGQRPGNQRRRRSSQPPSGGLRTDEASLRGLSFDDQSPSKPHRRRSRTTGTRTVSEKSSPFATDFMVLQYATPPPAHGADWCRMGACSAASDVLPVPQPPSPPSARDDGFTAAATRKARKFDAGTSMTPPPRIKSIRSRTYEQVEMGLILRRRALLATVRAAREELGHLCQKQMPPLLVTLRRDEGLSLEVPLDCDCTAEEKQILSRVLWQDEKREEWLQQQAEEASSLLRRAEDKMSKLARKTTLRKTISQGRRASTAMAFARRASTAQELAKRQEIANRASRPSTSRRPGHFFGLPTPCELVRRLRAFLADHLSTRSSSAKNEGRNPRPRVKKYDRRTALLVGIICVLVVPIPLVTSRWPRARLGLLGLEARSTNRTDAYDFTSAWCDGDLDVRNFTALERCVRETQELRAEIQLQDEAAAFMVAYATAPGVLLQALQAVVVFVPLLCCLLAPLTFWPLFEHNVDYVILGYLARQTQVRLTVLTQTVSFLLIAVNALFLGATDMPGVFEPAYIAVDALIMYICIACLICGDALHYKPPYTLGTVYVFTVSAMVMNFVSRRTFKVAREQTVLMAREQSVMMDFDLTVQNVLELLDTSTLAIVVSNCFDFFSNRRLTAWAPIKLTRHDLLNSIYLEKVRHAFFERSKLYRLLGLRSTAVEQKLGAQLGLDAAALNHIVVYIQTRWRARQERRRMRERGTARARRRWTLVANVSRSAGVLGSCSNLSAAGSLTESSQTSIVKGSAGDHICNEMKRSKVRQRRRVDLSSLGRSFKLPNGGEAAPSTAPNRQRRRRVSEQARAPLGVPASVVQERMRRSLSRVGSALGTRAKDLDAVVEHPADQVTIDDSTQPIQSKLRSQVREVQESEQELRSYENDPFGDWLGDLDD